MEKSKLVSFRLDEYTDEKIKKFCEARPYLNRSTVINGILRNVFLCSSEATLHELISNYFAFDQNYHLTFKIPEL